MLAAGLFLGFNQVYLYKKIVLKFGELKTLGIGFSLTFIGFIAITLTDNLVFKRHFELQPATGNVTVTSVPDGLSIYLDGRKTDSVTPASFTDILAGEHTVAVRVRLAERKARDHLIQRVKQHRAARKTPE